jgi:hypothetical protein
MRKSLWSRVISVTLALAIVVMFAPPPMIASADTITYVRLPAGGIDSTMGKYVANDNTPFSLHLSPTITGLSANVLYAYSICATTAAVASPTPTPAPGADLGYTWNLNTSQWVQADNWSQLPTITANGSGQLGTPWTYGKIADENLPAGTPLTFVVAFRQVNSDGSFPNSNVYYTTGSGDQTVTVQAVGGTGSNALAWAHACTSSGIAGPTRIAAIPQPYSAGGNTALSLVRNSAPSAAASSAVPAGDGTVNNLYGDGTGDFRLAVPASTTVGFVSGNSNQINNPLSAAFQSAGLPLWFVMGPADTDVAAGITTDTLPPTAPGSLTATFSAGRVSLGWGAASDNVAVTGYYVYRWQDPVTSALTPWPALTTSAPVRIATVTVGTAYADSSVAPGTYHYMVRAFDAATSVGPRTNTVTSAVSGPFTLTYTAGANGSIVGSSTQVVTYGSAGTTVTATPAANYHFVSWSDGVLTAARQDTNVTANKSVTANFAINTFTLSYTAGANGSIAGSSTQVVNYGANGTTVTATPATGYHFVSWSDGVLTAARQDTAVAANVSVTANFAINTYTLSYAAGANGSIAGSFTQVVNYGANGTTVTATPAAGYHFVSWSDGVLTAARQDTAATANVSVTANFAINSYTLSYAASANGTVSGAASQTVNYNGSGTTVTAVPNAGYHFVSWSDGVLTAARQDTAVASNVNVSASFAKTVNIPTSLTISSTATSVTRGKQFILSGLMTPTPGTVGVNVIVWVKKPGKSYYSYSSNRTVYAGVGGVASWQYKYNTLKMQPKGTYRFYVSFIANGTYLASHSVTKTISFK